MLFDEDLIVNKLIKEYLKKYEHREYMLLIFGKLFEKATDMNKYLKDLRGRKGNEGIMANATEATSDVLSVGEKSSDGQSDTSPMTKFIEDHFNAQSKPGVIPPAGSEEVKIIAEDHGSEKLTNDDVFLICDHILEMISKKLLYMPLSMRYFCKLLERITHKFVRFLIHTTVFNRIILP